MKAPGLNIFKGGQKPETGIRNAIKKALMGEGWQVFVTHGNEYQEGFPDLYCIHAKFGTRWVEVKNPNGYAFTEAQLRVFPQFASCNVGVWVLTSDHKDELAKLFMPANWWAYLGVMK
jgi:hypothetical protein